jgi:hypothetical protein
MESHLSVLSGGADSECTHVGMWERPAKPPGFSSRDMRVAETLLILNHHAHLLVRTIEELVDTEYL